MDGLAPQNRSVIVVGAGLAGLAAAWELRRAGFPVTVLEAQTRVGGRVRTLRGFPEDLHAEAGALFIPDTHAITLRYVSEFGLSLDPFKPPGLATVRFVGGRRTVVPAGAEWLPAMVPEGRRSGQPDGEELVRLIGDPADPGWPPASARDLDRLSYAQFVRERCADEASARPFLDFWGSLWGEGADTVSALALLRDWVHLRNLKHEYRIRGGNDLLPKAMAARLGDDLWLGCRVIRIEQSGGGVRVWFETLGTRHRLQAERVICAVPFSVLRRIEVSPPFSRGKAEAVAELPHFSASRLSVLMRRRFWREEGVDGFAVTDLPIGQVFNMTGNQAGRRGVLQCYAGGVDAKTLVAMAEDQRVRAVLDDLDRVYPGSRRNAEGFESYDWDKDPFARGASSWFRPGQLAELWPSIAAPEGRVHFAGDQTSAWIRWMQGALQSGLRAAGEVIREAETGVKTR